MIPDAPYALEQFPLKLPDYRLSVSGLNCPYAGQFGPDPL
jgi:hypothetical protein